MNELQEEKQINNIIYDIRGIEVMLDSDLAKLYECANGTKTINQAVKRHIKKFPERYMFQLTKEEYIDIVINELELLDSKIVIHRITADPDINTLVEPRWLVKKFCVLNDIDKEMVRRNTYQGKYFNS